MRRRKSRRKKRRRRNEKEKEEKGETVVFFKHIMAHTYLSFVLFLLFELLLIATSLSNCLLSNCLHSHLFTTFLTKHAVSRGTDNRYVIFRCVLYVIHCVVYVVFCVHVFRVFLFCSEHRVHYVLCKQQLLFGMIHFFTFCFFDASDVTRTAITMHVYQQSKAFIGWPLFMGEV